MTAAGLPAALNRLPGAGVLEFQGNAVVAISIGFGNTKHHVFPGPQPDRRQ